MDVALKQYQTQVQKGSWGGEPPEKKYMLSLAARVDTIQLQLNKSTSKKITNEEYRKKRYANAPPWMKKPPESPNEKCPYHKMWLMHSPSECVLNPMNHDSSRSRPPRPPYRCSYGDSRRMDDHKPPARRSNDRRGEYRRGDGRISNRKGQMARRKKEE
jgi:hypothetical protein